MRIGELAKLLGVSPDTIRNAEDRGLIQPQRDWNNQRRFTAEDVERIRERLFPRTSGSSQMDTRS